MIELLHDRFPAVDVTVIEWDPAMVEVASYLHLFSQDHEPRIIIDDATKALPQLSETFDLIIVDIFFGGKVAESVFAPTFPCMLRKVCHHQSFLLFNVFDRPDLFTELDKTFSRFSNWRFQYNILGLFRCKA